MIFYDVSTASDLHPIAEVLRDLSNSAARCGIEMMVVGAVARDLLIQHVAGAPPDRATADVDIAVAVSTWDELRLLTESIAMPRESPHRFTVRGMQVDVIPFGEIESKDRTIVWANDHLMNVFGFREAYASAVTVRLPGDVEVMVASLPAQSLLKLFAWRDRGHQDRRDAIDLRSILLTYHKGRYFDELYGAHLATLETYGFDPLLAGAHRLGSEAKLLIVPADLDLVRAVFTDELTSAIADVLSKQSSSPEPRDRRNDAGSLVSDCASGA
jgi:predicted nucleotidyltransferase